MFEQTLNKCNMYAFEMHKFSTRPVYFPFCCLAAQSHDGMVKRTTHSRVKTVASIFLFMFEANFCETY